MTIRAIIRAEGATSFFQESVLFLRQENAQGATEVLRDSLNRLEHSNAPAPLAEDTSDFWGENMSWARPYDVEDGIAHIPVKGVLLAGFPYAFTWATGYEYIVAAVTRAAADENVRGVAFEVNSPGGMVQGCFEACDAAAEVLKEAGKTSIALCETACSAAYAMASVADSVVVSRTGVVGSIGVLTSHMDVSKAADKAGIKMTFIYAGKFKVEGNPYEPLGAEAKDRIQQRIDYLYEMFVAQVSTNRSMDAKSVRDTEALTYYSDEAISIGLADSVEVLSTARKNFVDANGATQIDKSGVYGMTTKVNEGASGTVVDATAAQLSAARAEGAAAARKDILAVLTSPEAVGRMDTAVALACGDSGMSHDQCVAVLKTVKVVAAAPEAPAANASQANSAFAAAMGATQNPNAGVEAKSTAAEEAADPVSTILAAYSNASGYEFKKTA